MKQFILTTFALSISIMVSSQKSEQSELIDQYVKEMVTINQIPGLAIGVIKDGKVVLEKYYGTETLESNKRWAQTQCSGYIPPQN